MAALELQRGVWVGERPEIDSEMLEWEEQLQDMQRKIEELYNEVVARRGGSDAVLSNQPNDVTLLPVANKDAGRHNKGCYSNSNGDHQTSMSLQAPIGKGCGYQLNNPCGYTNGYHGNSAMDPTLEILHGYLEQGRNQKNRSIANTMQNSENPPDFQRFGAAWPVGRGEDFDKGRNRPNMYQESCYSGDLYEQRGNPGAKLLVRHRDNSPVSVPQGRPSSSSFSPSTDRKSAPLDRKQGSPSVLRKFGAMLHENEGKLLTDAGVVAPSPPPSLANSSPLAPRRAHTRTPPPPQHSQKHTHGHTPHGRSSDPSPPPVQHTHGHGHLHASLCPKGTPALVQSRPGHWGDRRERDAPCGRQAALQQGFDPAATADYWSVEQMLNGPSAPRRRSNSAGCYGNVGSLYGNGASAAAVRASREESRLDELLNTLDIQPHQPSVCRVTHTPPVSRDSSPASVRRTFSRPARPANQRPPSRWASQSSNARPRLPSHSGPLSRPPSPARKARPANQSFSSYSLHTETIIM